MSVLIQVMEILFAKYIFQGSNQGIYQLSVTSSDNSEATTWKKATKFCCIVVWIQAFLVVNKMVLLSKDEFSWTFEGIFENNFTDSRKSLKLFKKITKMLTTFKSQLISDKENDFWMCSFKPKNERKYFCIFALPL